MDSNSIYADVALRMRENPSELECYWAHSSIATICIVHFDESVMPKNKNLWRRNASPEKNNDSYTVYWMNSLQHVSKKKVLLTLTARTTFHLIKYIDR